MSIQAGSTETSAVSGLWTDVYILRRFVEMLQREILFPRFSEPAQIPRNTGGYIARWNIPVANVGSATTIEDAAAGTTGELTDVTINNVESTIHTYGEFMKIGEIAELSQVSGAMDVYAEQFAYRGATVIESRLYTAAKTSSNFLHSGDTEDGGATLATGDTATLSDFGAIAGFFYNQNARGFSELGGKFAWVMHPTQEVHLTTELTSNNSLWGQSHDNDTGQGSFLVTKNRMIGSYANVAAFRSTLIGTVNEDVTAYQSIALAKWGLGWAGLGESGPSKPEIIRKKPGREDTSQPLNLYQTIAWKVKMAEKLLDASRVLVVYSHNNVS